MATIVHTQGLKTKPTPPRVKGDPLRSVAYVRYLRRLVLPGDNKPLQSIPAHQRPTFEEWDLLRRLKARDDAEAHAARVEYALDLGAEVIVENVAADGDLEAFSFDEHARQRSSALLQQDQEAAILRNAARLADMGIRMENVGAELRQRAVGYERQLFKWMQTPTQIAQEKMLRGVYPAALSLKAGVADAGDVLALSLGDKTGDNERWVSLIDRLTVNAITARLLVYVRDHFKLTDEEARWYLDYHRLQNQIPQQEGNAEMRSMLQEVLNVARSTNKLPAEPYPQPKSRRSRREVEQHDY